MMLPKPTTPKPTGPMTLDQLLAHPGLRQLLDEAVQRKQEKEIKRQEDALWRYRQIHGTDAGFYKSWLEED